MLGAKSEVLVDLRPLSPRKGQGKGEEERIFLSAKRKSGDRSGGKKTRKIRERNWLSSKKEGGRLLNFYSADETEETMQSLRVI